MSAIEQEIQLQSSVLSLVDMAEVKFKRSARPGAVVAVTIGRETVHVRAEALLMAVKLMQVEGDN